MTRRRTRLVVLSILVVMIGATSMARAAEQAVRGEAPWDGRARIYITGPQQAFLLGAFIGRLAIDPNSSILHDARLMCPGTFDLDYATSSIRGEGRCIITTSTGDVIFARWSCVGQPEKGCSGRFVITGGTGAYQGVTGDGDLTLRLTFSELTGLRQIESDYDVKGLVTWPALRYRTP